MTYKESYEKCESLDELKQEVNKDIAYALLINKDRIKPIVSAAEEVMNVKFADAMLAEREGGVGC